MTGPTAAPPRPPLRLPPGWVAVDAPPGVRAAVGPHRLPLGQPGVAARPMVSVADWPEGDASDLVVAAAGLHAAFVRDVHEVQLLDEGAVRLADGRPAYRLLSACCDEDGLPRTVEQWVAPGASGVLVLNASAPTPLWPALGPRLQRVLRSAGHERGGPPASLPGGDGLELALPPPAQLEVSFGGARSSVRRVDGSVTGTLPDGVVLVDLPLALLPHWLAAAAAWGPRPSVDVAGLVLTEPARLDALAQGEPGPLADELTGAWSTAVRELGAARPGRLTVCQPGGVVDLLDGGAAGLWATWYDGEQAGLRPVTTTEAWSALVAACCC